MTKFRLTSTRKYWWPVVVRFPDPDPKNAGAIIEQQFEAQFCEIPRDEAIALAGELAKLAPAERDAREHDLILRVTTGWNEAVVDEKDQPLPFTIERLREAMQSVYFRAALYGAYAQSQTGTPAKHSARVGN